MNIGQLLAENWVSLVFALLSAGLLGYFKYLHSQFKKLQDLKEKELKEQILKELKTTLETLKLQMGNDLLALEKELKAEIGKLSKDDERFERYFSAIRDSWRYRYTSLCEMCLTKGYLTTEEYLQLNEMWSVYHNIDGNGQGDAMHLKVENLPIRNNKGSSN